MGALKFVYYGIRLLVIALGVSVLIAGPVISQESRQMNVRDFLGIWMGISHDDGSFFKVTITDSDRDGVAEVIMHDTFWSLCNEAFGLTGMETTLVPALVTGPGTVDTDGNLVVNLTFQCRNEQNVDLGPPIGPLPVAYVPVSKHQLLLTTGMFAPSPVFRVGDIPKRGPRPRTVRDFIGLWMGVSYDDGSFFKVAITDNNRDGVAEVIFHDTFWSICNEVNNLTGLETTLVPALVTGPGTINSEGNLSVPLTFQCRDEQNQDLGPPIGPLPISFVVKPGNYLELTTGMFDPSPIFRVNVSDNNRHHRETVSEYERFGSAVDKSKSEVNTKGFTLESNYPNPFNPSTMISYQLKESAPVKIRVYDLNGRLVTTLLDQQQSSGKHSVSWDGKNSSGEKVASGVYLYKIEIAGESLVRRMTLAK